jgi:hypothetical protein
MVSAGKPDDASENTHNTLTFFIGGVAGFNQGKGFPIFLQNPLNIDVM